MILKRVFICLVYFTAAAAVFAVLRFPHQAAAEKTARMAEQMFPGSAITLDRVSPVFPLGLTSQTPVIRLADKILVIPRDIHVRLPLSAVLGWGNTLHYRVSLLEGTLAGHLSGVSLSPPGYAGVTADLAGLRFSDLALALEGGTVRLSFVLSGRYQEPDRQNSPAGTGDLFLSQVTCAIQDNFLNTFGITDLDFDRITVSFVRENRTIQISALTAQGSVMAVSAEGQIVLAQGSPSDPENWTFDLKGLLHPQPAHVSRFSGILPVENLFRTDPEKGIPFTLTGPVPALEIRL
jgi:type II secretion system protein N